MLHVQPAQRLEQLGLRAAGQASQAPFTAEPCVRVALRLLPAPWSPSCLLHFRCCPASCLPHATPPALPRCSSGVAPHPPPASPTPAGEKAGRQKPGGASATARRRKRNPVACAIAPPRRGGLAPHEATSAHQPVQVAGLHHSKLIAGDQHMEQHRALQRLQPPPLCGLGLPPACRPCHVRARRDMNGHPGADCWAELHFRRTCTHRRAHIPPPCGSTALPARLLR